MLVRVYYQIKLTGQHNNQLSQQRLATMVEDASGQSENKFVSSANSIIDCTAIIAYTDVFSTEELAKSVFSKKIYYQNYYKSRLN